MDGVEAKRRREALRKSQRELAKIAGISNETVRKFEQGGHVHADSVEAIRSALEESETIQAIVKEVVELQKNQPSIPERLKRIEEDLADLRSLVIRALDARDS